MAAKGTWQDKVDLTLITSIPDGAIGYKISIGGCTSSVSSKRYFYNEFFVVFYEFSEDCFWDKMILKDEMTVVLVKDNNYFWAKRMSEKDPAGLYGSYF